MHLVGPLPPRSAASTRNPPEERSVPHGGIRARMVGLAILYPLRCRIGRTAPSVAGSRNLLLCHEVASAPVSASHHRPLRPPPDQGCRTLRRTRGTARSRVRRPRESTRGLRATCEGIPPGNENCLNSACIPISTAGHRGSTANRCLPAMRWRPSPDLRDRVPR